MRDRAVQVGRVTIVHCNGRIVAGGESDDLREHIVHLLRDRRSIAMAMIYPLIGPIILGMMITFVASSLSAGSPDPAGL